MKCLTLEHHPNDSRIKISEDGICQSLTSRMGTGGNNVPLVLCIGDIRATTIVINERTNSFGVESESRNDNG